MYKADGKRRDKREEMIGQGGSTTGNTLID